MPSSARYRASTWGAVIGVALSLVLFSATSESKTRPKEREPFFKISGIVTAITPSRITIQGTQGGPVTLVTSRDYRDEVAFGSDVEARYTVERGIKVLESLTPPLESLFVPAYEIRREIHTVIVLPDSRVEGSGDFFDAMEHYLRSQFGWYVKPRVLAEEARRYAERTQSTLNLINPKTGAVDISQYTPGRHDLIRQIAAVTRVDAVLDARLVVHSALLDARHRVAIWDGYKEFASDRPGTGLGRMAPFPVRAEIPATTLEVTLWNSQGKPLWSRRRGFAVLYVEEGLLGKLRPWPLEDALQNKAAVNEWFNSFFAPLRASAERRSANPHQR